MTLVPGQCRAFAVGAEMGLTSKKLPQVAITFEISDDGPNACQKAVWYGYFTPKTAKRTIQTLRWCGWQGNDLSDLSSVIWGSSPTAQEVQLTLEEDTYNDKTRVRVSWVNRIGEGGGAALANPMTENEKKAFAAKLLGSIAKVSLEDPDCKPLPPNPNTQEKGSRIPFEGTIIESVSADPEAEPSEDSFGF